MKIVETCKKTKTGETTYCIYRDPFVFSVEQMSIKFIILLNRCELTVQFRANLINIVVLNDNEDTREAPNSSRQSKFTPFLPALSRLNIISFRCQFIGLYNLFFLLIFFLYCYYYVII